MITITNNRQTAKDIAYQIHEWRTSNITGYNATSWANCELSDVEYDALYKHQTDDLWYVPLDNLTPLEIEKSDSIPNGWFKPSDESI